MPSIKTNIRRKPISLHSNYSKQTVKSINCFSSYYISENKFINVNIFLVGITYKIFRPLIKKNLYFIFKNFYKIILSIFLIYFVHKPIITFVCTLELEGYIHRYILPLKVNI